MDGGTPTIKKYKVAAGHAVGIIVLRAAAEATGLSTSGATNMANSVGLVIDQGLQPAAGGPIAFSTVQGQPEAVYGVIVNPNAILRAQMVSQATGTTLSTGSVTTTNSN